jgi:hypothetical protein
MLSDGGSTGCDELPRQLETNGMSFVISQPRKFTEDGLLEGRGCGIFAQNGRGELAIERAHVANELGETEIHEPMELSEAIAEVLDESFVKEHELAQLVSLRAHGRLGRQSLLSRETRDT